MKINFRKYLKDGILRPHRAAKKEIQSFTKLVARDLRDCAIEELSIDRRFATAYQAALNLSRLVVTAYGYRVSAKTGHHAITFEIAGIILGRKCKEYINLFDICRRKRNKKDKPVGIPIRKIPHQRNGLGFRRR